MAHSLHCFLVQFGKISRTKTVTLVPKLQDCGLLGLYPPRRPVPQRYHKPELHISACGVVFLGCWKRQCPVEIPPLLSQISCLHCHLLGEPTWSDAHGKSHLSFCPMCKNQPHQHFMYFPGIPQRAGVLWALSTPPPPETTTGDQSTEH